MTAAEPLPARHLAPTVPKVRDASGWMLREHPELRHALQPPARGVLAVPLELNGAFRHRFAPTARGLVGPFPSEGDCLTPFVAPGRHDFWIDPTLEPAAGDLVLVHAGPHTLAEMLAGAAENPAWCEKYRGGFSDVWLKQLAWDGRRWLMVERTTGWPLMDSRLLGVVRFVRPSSRISLHATGAVNFPRIQPAQVDTPFIADGAASDVYQSTFTGPTTYNLDGQTVATVTFVADEDCVARAIATFDASIASGTGTGQVILTLTGSITGGFQDTSPFDTTTRRLTQQRQHAFVAGETVTATVTANGLSDNVTVANVTLNLRNNKK